jgi:hypothetical protein
MKVKNIVRKAVALGSGAALVGTTLMGAFAYDLSTYPAQYIVNGQFDGKIVVGEKAATADVLGSIDIAASLQGASVTKVPVAGQAGQVSVSGDAYELDTGNDKVELREPIGEVVDTITSSDLAGLKSGKVTTSQGSTDYHQYLRLKDGSNLQNTTVNYVENDDDVLADYLMVDTDLPFLEWEIQFPEGLESDVASGELEDLDDRAFNIMGTDFTIVDATLTSNDNVELEMMGGSVPDTLREGETKTYKINGVDYEVTLVFVSDPNSNAGTEVKFSVNGELTPAMTEGETETLSGGLQIGVRDILVNSREGVASFFLGADKIVFTDDTASNADNWDGNIEINDDSISDADVRILGSNVTATKFEITSIKYRLTMDAEDGTTAYIPKGKGVKEFMKRPESLISETLDIRYEGLTAPETKEFQISPKSDDKYEMTFTNINGVTYTVPLLSNQDGAWKFGNSDDELVFVEAANKATYNIGRDNYFIVSNDRGTDTDKSVTNVLQYTDYDTTDRTLEFEDLGTGSTVSVPIAADGTGSLVIGGHTYAVNVSNISAAAPDLAIDLNADGAFGDVVQVTTWGGVTVNLLANAEIDTPSNISSATAIATLALYIGKDKTLENASSGATQYVTMSATVLSKNFDTSDGGNEQLNWTITENQADVEADLSVGAYAGPLDGTQDYNDYTFVTLESNDDLTQGLTDYGMLVKEDASGDTNEFTLVVPKQQRFAQVFVTLGDVTSTEGSAGSADRVNPIAVGLAVLDKDAPAFGEENLIVVGGPCANSAAAALLGNPANCGEGFEAGKATIQSWEKNGKVAILVAGYEATETLGASRVLADYKKHSLKGTEVEVVVADLNSIEVKSMS